jgi:hypothetical protein
MSSEQLVTRIDALPEDARRSLLAFLDFLTERSGQPTPQGASRVFKFDWEGGLADAFPGATAVELQHRANEWR